MKGSSSILLSVSIALSSFNALMAILMILVTCVWFKDKNKNSIRNLVERILCIIGCVGVVLLALSWTFFYMVKQCILLYTENLIPWEILVGIVALASVGISWNTFVIALSLTWWCILRYTGHHSRPVSEINGKLPVEEKYEYIAPLPHVHVHVSRDAVNQPERPDGSSIPLSANESYSATTRF